MKKKFEKQILKYGEWFYPGFPENKLTIDKGLVKSIVQNHKYSPFVPAIRGHNDEEAVKNPNLIISKNIKSLREGEDGLYAEMEIDEKELEKYNDVSAKLDLKYIDTKTGKVVGPVIKSVAFTTDPHVKDLEPFVALEDTDSIETYIINLSETKAMKKAKKTKVELEETTEEAKAESKGETKEAEVKEKAEAKEESKEEAKVESKEEEAKEESKEEAKEEPKKEVELSDSARERIVELEEKLANYEGEIALSEAKAKYEKLLSGGKILPAQKSAYINLHLNSGKVVELSDGNKASVGELIDALYDKAPKVIEFEEKGLDSEALEGKESKMKLEMRKQWADLSDKAFEKKYDKFEKTIKKEFEKK